ncbi:substrate-binding domain-containing protein [Methanofollis tationis]|uniref:Substrate-binding domain-containing protein n=1 Tax=Methanofollis tationis TaxID=81417 RepID=A0A7K4HMP7_9EURY|nr:substrate-binding domain-containing protein [Methanofollis tationis]NVO66546.1 substrate-binding domain-containing protein [Methanofollis tationis]
MKKGILMVLAVIMVAAAIAAGCTGTSDREANLNPSETRTLLLATTTSLYDTGLLDALKAPFEKEYNAKVDIISAGTGTALGYGENGDVDVMMVHDRAREDAFIENGHGIDRRVIAYNYFVIVGPEADPAGVKNMNPEEAFTTIREKGLADPAQVKFVSRGDNSGTHAKEKAIWNGAGFNYTTDITKSGDWYIEAGTGMGATLVMADEKAAYTLSDIGTYLAYKDKIALVPVVSEGEILLNVYSVMRINPEKHPGVNSSLAKDWINYLITPSTQKTIEEFGVETYGEPLFFPAAGNWDTMGVNRSEVEGPVV